MISPARIVLYDTSRNLSVNPHVIRILIVWRGPDDNRGYRINSRLPNVLPRKSWCRNIHPVLQGIRYCEVEFRKIITLPETTVKDGGILSKARRSK